MIAKLFELSSLNSQNTPIYNVLIPPFYSLAHTKFMYIDVTKQCSRELLQVRTII